MAKQNTDILVKTIIKRELCLPAMPESASLLIKDLNADELNIVELTLALEEEFNVSISDNVMDGWKTVSDVVACISENKLK